MNIKYDHLKVIWVGYDTISMQLAIVMSVNLFFFHQYVMFSKSQHQQDMGGIVGLSVSGTTYIGSVLNLYGLWLPAIVCFIVSNGQSRKQRNDYWRLVYSKVTRRDTFAPKQLVYPGMTALLFIWFLIFNASDLAIQEQDYVMDSFIMVCCFCMWVSQPRHLRHRDVPSIIVIVVCLKLIYFNDNEKGMNNIVEPELVDGREWA